MMQQKDLHNAMKSFFLFPILYAFVQANVLIINTVENVMILGFAQKACIKFHETQSNVQNLRTN